jgi:hypothetical protein
LTKLPSGKDLCVLVTLNDFSPCFSKQSSWILSGGPSP